MTDTCKECRFRSYCEEFKYNLDHTNQNDCEHFEAYVEGMEMAYWVDD